MQEWLWNAVSLIPDVQVSFWLDKNGSLRHCMKNLKQQRAEPDIKDAVIICLDPEMNWYGSASGKRGRSPTFSDAAIQFCLAIKSLSGLPLREAMPVSKKLLVLAGLNWAVPDFSTVCRRRKHVPDVTAGVYVTPGSHLLISDNGVKVLLEEKWTFTTQDPNAWGAWRRLPVIFKSL